MPPRRLNAYFVNRRRHLRTDRSAQPTHTVHLPQLRRRTRPTLAWPASPRCYDPHAPISTRLIHSLTLSLPQSEIALTGGRRLTATTDAIQPASFVAQADDQSEDVLWKTRRVARFLDVSPGSQGAGMACSRMLNPLPSLLGNSMPQLSQKSSCLGRGMTA